MEIVVVGVNHRAAPVAVREHLAFSPAQMDVALAHLRERTVEGAIVSTCNRTEIYAVVPSGNVGGDEIMAFLAGFHRVDVARFAPFLYSMQGREAVGHLFGVAAGLDSMILGEPQILGQVRRAYLAASSRGNAGPLLSWIFLHAFKAGKRVRTETGISRNAVSISHAAVELARKALGTLAGRNVLLIGAGEMAELAARNLMDNGAERLTVANRTHRRAVDLAQKFGAAAVEFNALPDALVQADAVITSTGAPNFILSADAVRAAMAKRPERPLFLVDIAVPRDVDPGAASVENVFLSDIDDLQSVCFANLEERQREVNSAQRIIDDELDAFDTWWHSLEVVPTIRALRGRAEEIRQAELRKALSRLGDLSERQRSALEALTLGIVNKMLHQPTVKLKSSNNGQDSAVYATTLRELFGLEGSQGGAGLPLPLGERERAIGHVHGGEGVTQEQGQGS